MAQSQKSKTKKKTVRRARTVRIAEAKVAGQTNKAIAAAEGLTAEWVSRELRSDESRQLIDGLLKTDLPRIGRIYAMALTAIEEAHKAKKTGCYLGGCVDLGPDHYARLAAAKRYMELISLGRPTAKLPEVEPAKENDRMTLEDAKALSRGELVRPQPGEVRSKGVQ